MYGIMVLVSWVIRGYLMPNPLKDMINGEMINWGLTIILTPITYEVVGIFYEKNSRTLLGSFLYLLFYMIHTGILLLIGWFQWNKVAFAIILILYVFITRFVSKLINRSSG